MCRTPFFKKKKTPHNKIRVRGKITFHANFIKKSYRNRGNVPRNIKKSKIMHMLQIFKKKKWKGKKKNDVKNLIKIIFPYSPKKRRAKTILLYSVLNPETSSLSPSAKSNGERLVSATMVIIQKTKMITKKKEIPQKDFDKIFILNVWPKHVGKKIKDKRAIS